MSRFETHRRVLTTLEPLYRRWGREGRLNHSRGIDWVGTWGARAASWFFPDILWRVTRRSAERFDLAPPEKRTLYLTIDDGPTPGTSAILDVLARHAVPATMFLVGTRVRERPSLVREMHEAGHVVGNHTETHCDAWSVPFEQVADEFRQTDDVLTDLTGTAIRWVRPPQGHFTPRMRAWCRDHGLKITMWDILPADFSPRSTAEQVIRFTLRHVRPGSVLVLHDNDRTQEKTPEVLATLLPQLKDRGWSFGTL